ncbi:MAG TPA: carboxypeptidase regulatory-like domain-containing protein [Anaeromyxobacteraceae bacterium]
MRDEWRWIAAAALLAAGPAAAGELAGTVRFEGTAPVPAPLAVTKDGAVCGASQPDESLLVQGDRLANVVVVVKGLPPAPPSRVALGQERCRFLPHVQVAPLGSRLDLVNGDGILHGVRGWMERRTRFDVAMASQGKEEAPGHLDRPGVIQVRCDVHAWMASYIVVADGPAAVSAADGTFTVRDVPPGRYMVSAWHERLGEQRAEVTVPDRGVVRLELRFR